MELLEDLDQTKRHRTTLNLPVELLEAAQKEVETNSATVAVTTALRELVAARRRERLLAVELPDLTLESLKELRQPRFPAKGERNARAR